jgi:hypothetical protein
MLVQVVVKRAVRELKAVERAGDEAAPGVPVEVALLPRPVLAIVNPAAGILRAGDRDLSFGEVLTAPDLQALFPSISMPPGIVPVRTRVCPSFRPRSACAAACPVSAWGTTEAGCGRGRLARSTAIPPTRPAAAAAAAIAAFARLWPRRSWSLILHPPDTPRAASPPAPARTSGRRAV